MFARLPLRRSLPIFSIGSHTTAVLVRNLSRSTSTQRMSNNITVTFLGTTSGGGPTETRNCSSLVLEPLLDGSLWMVDCAEGTARQVAMQPWPSKDMRRIKLSKITKIFITHMHADHMMGILPLLRNVLGIPRLPSQMRGRPPARHPSHPRIEIYGPRGLRRLLRMLTAATNTNTEMQYAVHELLFPGEAPDMNANATPVDPAVMNNVGWREHVACEAPGRDIACDADGLWRRIEDVAVGGHGGRRIVIDAGPIEHRDPCIGYVFREVARPSASLEHPMRTIVILGDTYDASGVLPLLRLSVKAAPLTSASEPSSLDADKPLPPPTSPPPPPPAAPRPLTVSLLIHEATDACIPRSIDPSERTGRNRTTESVKENAIARGHSTPAMAGEFARRCGAERLVLNHIGARFPAANGARDTFRAACMAEIERQATTEWAPPSGARAQAAYDYMRVVVPPIGTPVEAEMEIVATETTMTWGSGGYVEQTNWWGYSSTAQPGPQANGYVNNSNWNGGGYYDWNGNWVASGVAGASVGKNGYQASGSGANASGKRELDKEHRESATGRDSKRSMSTYAGQSAVEARDAAQQQDRVRDYERVGEHEGRGRDERDRERDRKDDRGRSDYYRDWRYRD